MDKSIKCLVEFESKQLRAEFEKFISENEQVFGYQVDFGIVKTVDKKFYSYLDPFDMVFQMTSYMKDQVAKSTCQCGDIAILNKYGSSNDDLPSNSFGRKVWFNATVSTRTDGFSRLDF